MRGFADVVRLPAPRRQPCDLPELLQSIAVLLGPELAKRRIAWVWDVAEPPPAIGLDPVQIEQALVNVCKNSMEAIGQDGTITIRMGRKGGRSFLIIEDTGPGLSPEAQANLFIPFFSTKENGQGIGLTLMQEVLSEHRFDFSLEGRPGAPTQFTIFF